MSIWKEWGDNAEGKLIVANQPFADRVGYCYVTKDSIVLPNGVTVEGARGTRVSDYLHVGALAVAVRHTGDFFNNYVPVSVSDDDESSVTLTPFPDLEFGAYTFGKCVGTLETDDLRKVAAGLAITYTGQTSMRLAPDRAASM